MRGEITIGLLQPKPPCLHAKSLALFAPTDIVISHQAGYPAKTAQPLNEGIRLNVLKPFGAEGNYLNDEKNCTIAKGNGKQ